MNMRPLVHKERAWWVLIIYHIYPYEGKDSYIYTFFGSFDEFLAYVHRIKGKERAFDAYATEMASADIEITVLGLGLDGKKIEFSQEQRSLFKDFIYYGND